MTEEDKKKLGEALLKVLDSLAEDFDFDNPAAPKHFPEKGLDFYEATKTYQKKLIIYALKKANGSQTVAAKLLSIRLTTLNSMIMRYQIQTGGQRWSRYFDSQTCQK